MVVAAGPDPLSHKAHAGRTREIQRLQKLLEDAGIKLDSVVTDVMGKSAREMIETLIAGERDAAVLVDDMARPRMRPKIGELQQALVGRFDEHHALMARMHLDHIDQLNGIVDRLDAEVDRLIQRAGPSLSWANARLDGRDTGTSVAASLGRCCRWPGDIGGRRPPGCRRRDVAGEGSCRPDACPLARRDATAGHWNRATRALKVPDRRGSARSGG